MIIATCLAADLPSLAAISCNFSKLSWEMLVVVYGRLGFCFAFIVLLGNHSV